MADREITESEFLDWVLVQPVVFTAIVERCRAAVVRSRTVGRHSVDVGVLRAVGTQVVRM